MHTVVPDIFIILLLIFLHVSVCKGPSSGNKTKVIHVKPNYPLLYTTHVA
jgi:hypothetical protein